MPLSPDVQEALEEILDYLSEVDKYLTEPIKQRIGDIFPQLNALLEAKDTDDDKVFMFFAEHETITAALRFELRAIDKTKGWTIDNEESAARRMDVILAPEDKLQQLRHKKADSTMAIDSALQESQQLELERKRPLASPSSTVSLVSEPLSGRPSPDLLLESPVSLSQSLGSQAAISQSPASLSALPLDSEEPVIPPPTVPGLEGLDLTEEKRKPIEPGQAEEVKLQRKLPDLPDILSTISAAQLEEAKSRLAKETKEAPTNSEYFHKRLSRAAGAGDLPMMLYLQRSGVSLQAQYPEDNKYVPAMAAAISNGQNKAMILFFQLGYKMQPRDIRELVRAFTIQADLFPPAKLKEIWGRPNVVILEDGSKARLFYNSKFKSAYEGNGRVFAPLKPEKKGEEVDDSVSETDLEAKDVDQSTILYYACSGGDLDTVRFLCEWHRKHEVPLEQKNRFRETPLSPAIFHDHIRIEQDEPTGVVPYLIKTQKFSLTYVDSAGYTPLHLARSFNMAKYITEAAIEAKAGHILRSRTTRENGEETALMSICRFGNFKEGDLRNLVILLTNRDRTLFAGNAGYTPLVNMQNAKGETLICMIVDGKTPNLTSQQQKEALTALASRPDANTNIASNTGRTPLIAAVSHNSAEHVQILLDHSADVNLRDRRRFTPLMYVSNPKIAEMLLKKGARIRDEDNQGFTAMHFVTIFGYEECLNLLKVLVKYGGDINAEAGPDRITPLDKAILMRSEGRNAGVIFSKVNALVKLGAKVTESTLKHALQHLRANYRRNSERSADNLDDCNIFNKILRTYIESGQPLNASLIKSINKFIARRMLSPKKELAEALIADAQGNNYKAKRKDAKANRSYAAADAKYEAALAYQPPDSSVAFAIDGIHWNKAKKMGFRLPDDKAKDETMSESARYPKIVKSLQYCIKADINNENDDDLVFIADQIEEHITADRLVADSFSREEQVQLAALKKSAQRHDDKMVSLGQLHEFKAQGSALAQYLLPIVGEMEMSPLAQAEPPALEHKSVSLDTQLERARDQFRDLSPKLNMLRHIRNITRDKRKSMLAKLQGKKGTPEEKKELSSRENLQHAVLAIITTQTVAPNQPTAASQFAQLYQQSTDGISRYLQNEIQQTKAKMTQMEGEQQQALLTKLEQKLEQSIQDRKANIASKALSREETIQLTALRLQREKLTERPDEVKSVIIPFEARHFIEIQQQCPFPDAKLEEIERLSRTLETLAAEKRTELYDKLVKKEIDARLAHDSPAGLSRSDALQLAALQDILQPESKDKVNDKAVTNWYQHYLAFDSDQIQRDIDHVKLGAAQLAALEEILQPDIKATARWNQQFLESETLLIQREIQNLKRFPRAEQEKLMTELITQFTPAKPEVEVKASEEKLTPAEEIQLEILEDLRKAGQLDHNKPQRLEDELERMEKLSAESGIQAAVLPGLIRLSGGERQDLKEALEQKRHSDIEERLSHLRPLQFQILKSLIDRDAEVSAENNYRIAFLAFHLRYNHATSAATPETEKLNPIKPGDENYLKTALSYLDKVEDDEDASPNLLKTTKEFRAFLNKMYKSFLETALGQAEDSIKQLGDKGLHDSLEMKAAISHKAHFEKLYEPYRPVAPSHGPSLFDEKSRQPQPTIRHEPTGHDATGTDLIDPIRRTGGSGYTPQ